MCDLEKLMCDLKKTGDAEGAARKKCLFFCRKIQKIAANSLEKWPWRGSEKNRREKWVFTKSGLKKTGRGLKKTGGDFTKNPSFFCDSLL